MSSSSADTLRTADCRAALAFVADVADALDAPDGFARCGVERLPALAASELTTLSVCDLASGRREVSGVPPGAIGADERAAFDRHFRSHPLVRYHTAERGRQVHRISDSVPFSRFREGELYAEYYRRVGIDHAVALPVYVDGGSLVSFVLNRRGRDFDDREVALLEEVRAPLASLYACTRLLRRARSDAQAEVAAPPPTLARSLPLTAREHDVLRWVAAGKTDRDIAAILAISHRTVHKHLQRIYTKLGVETRTAAAMRAVRWTIPEAACGRLPL